ncbi:MAG: type VI secretion system baseplate subunit TssE [Pyrinomonadaceae bacterium]
MARTDNEIRITPSVLDRLLDFEPNVSSEAPKSRSKSLRDLKIAIRRDLEWLLNTRQFIEEIPANLEETNKSVAVYGLPDFTSASAKSSVEQRRLVKQIETALRLFEPRFLDLKVTLEPTNSIERVLRFRIDARLDLEPTPEPVSFDTVFQYGSSEFSVVEK